MERRSALKNIGMAFGYAVATPTLLGIVQSCKEKAAYAAWVPEYFEKDQGYAIAQIVDIILPKTDTPSATEMNVHMFIDEFASKVMMTQAETVENIKSEFESFDGDSIKSNNKDFFSMTLNTFTDAVLKSAGKDAVTDLEPKDYEPLLAKYLKERSDETGDAHSQALNAYAKAVVENGSAELDSEIACYEFAGNIRGMATWAYKSSEYIGEEVLAYLPIPGEYVACGDLEELTQGRDWSLK